jgi:hypothetical protein
LPFWFAHVRLFTNWQAGKPRCSEREDEVGGRLTAPRGPVGAQPNGEVLPGEFCLRDGTPAMIRPVLPADAESCARGFAGCRGIRAATGSSHRSVDSMTR